MNLLADESVDRPIVTRLRQDGHTVLAMADLDPGVDDESVLRLANQNSALLLTADKDFGELVFRMGSIHTGVVLIRLAGLSPETKARIVLAAFTDHQNELSSAFSVVSSGRIRIRRRTVGSERT